MPSVTVEILVLSLKVAEMTKAKTALQDTNDELVVQNRKLQRLVSVYLIVASRSQPARVGAK